MNPVPLTDHTRRLGAPKTRDHEDRGICHTLEVCDRDGWMISAWQPTDAEIKRILDGKPVFLHIGVMDEKKTHPVVALSIGE